MDKSQLLSPHLPTAEVKLADGAVTVRGLSRAEAVALGSLSDPGEIEAKLLATCLVEPPLTAEEVEIWRNAAPSSELDPVTTAILELSGLLEGAQKAAMLSFRDGSGEGVRVPPGERSEDDAG